MPKFEWVILNKTSNNTLTPDLLSQTLIKNRKISNLEDFLSPNLNSFLNLNFGEIDKAVSRIKKAIENREKIVVYSDYDADGICGTAILWETLHRLKANVLPYIPDRVSEGYGLNNEAIKKLKDDGVGLIITVDHGVAAFEEIEYAKSLGVDVIITDHHVLPEKLPVPFAFIHTTELAGAGVAFRFAIEIGRIYGIESEVMNKIELAALATIADLVPLIGYNRAIVKVGLEKINHTQRVGLLALFEQAGIIKGKIGVYEIGHLIAPRINASGRLENAISSLRLLCTNNPKQARVIARELSITNTKRQDLTQNAVEQARNMVDSNRILVLAHSEWHEGIIGLVASRVVEEFKRPAIAISKGQIFSKGSARSIAGFNIVEAIRSCEDLLIKAGGHPMAAGFTIETKNIQKFIEKINIYIEKITNGKEILPQLLIDCHLYPQNVNFDHFNTVQKFSPFGIGNNEPVFIAKKASVEEVRTVGNTNRHLKLKVSGMEAIGFNLGGFVSQIRPRMQIDLAYCISLNEWNGSTNLQMKIKDLDLDG